MGAADDHAEHANSGACPDEVAEGGQLPRRIVVRDARPQSHRQCMPAEQQIAAQVPVERLLESYPKNNTYFPYPLSNRFATVRFHKNILTTGSHNFSKKRLETTV